MRKLPVSVALILVSAGALWGQTEESLRVLALPDSQPIFCREPAKDPAHPLPPQVVAREFFFGTPSAPDRLQWSREITIAFDTAGRAVLLSDERSFGRFGGESVIAMLDSTGALDGKRVDITVDSAAQERALRLGDVQGGLAAVRPPVVRPLTPEERKQMSALTAWLWKHKCPAGSGDPAPTRRSSP